MAATEFGTAGVDVALGGAQVGVAGQHPHRFDASSYLEQAGAKEVAQLMETPGQ